MITVLYADDHVGISETFSDSLRREFRVLAPVHSLGGLWEALTLVPVDVVLLDISFKDESALAHLPHLRIAFPEIRFLVFSAYYASVFGLPAQAAGAHGYCEKSGDMRVIAAAIHQVMVNGFSSLTLAEVMALPCVQRDSRESLATEKWSRRKQVHWLLRSGYLQKDIAGILNVTVKDVEHHVSVLRQERGLHGSGERHDWVREGVDGALLLSSTRAPSAQRPAPSAQRPAPSAQRRSVRSEMAFAVPYSA